MNRDSRNGRPRQEAPAPKTLTADVKSTAYQYAHGALLAADATAWFNRLRWERAIHVAAKSGATFTADELQAEHGLPDIGNACGGVFMALHRSGVIKRVGYRPSEKHSRAGGVVAIWTAGAAT